MIDPAIIETCKDMLKRGRNDDDLKIVNEILINEPDGAKKALCIDLNKIQDKFRYKLKEREIVKETPKFPVLPFNPE